MKRRTESESETWRLLASGPSEKWDVAVDEATDGNEWTLELDGPQAYLRLQLLDLKVVAKALAFLESGPPSQRIGRGDGKLEKELVLGRFGSASVSLLWDNERFPRCFIVVRPKRSALRLTLDAEDIQMLRDALRQVIEELPECARS